MEMLTFSLPLMEHSQVEDTCQIHLSMEKFTPDLNNNGCSETTILKDMKKFQEVGTSFSLVTITHQKVTAPMIMEFTTPLVIPLQELLKNLTLPSIIPIAQSLI